LPAELPTAADAFLGGDDSTGIHGDGSSSSVIGSSSSSPSSSSYCALTLGAVSEVDLYLPIHFGMCQANEATARSRSVGAHLEKRSPHCRGRTKTYTS
jgi:hypothetical protein